MGDTTLKLAKIADVWRAVRKSNKRSLERVHVRWSGISRLTDGEVEVVRPITLICGENGAGKSSLLHTLLHAVTRDGAPVDGSSYCRPLDGALEFVEIEVSSEGGSTPLRKSEDIADYFFPNEGGPRFAFIDAGMHVPAILEFIKRDSNFTDLIEGVDPVRFDADALELASFIVGRSYTGISVFEISDSAFGDVLPYFRVESQGATYDTVDMGYGEIAVFYLLWVLGRVEAGALILIEEPETFLSPRAQTALVDVIAQHVVRRKLQVIMTSHSGAIAARMLNDEIIYTTRSSGKVALHSPARTADLVARLGLVPEKVFVFFLEDHAAEIFARVLIDNYSNRLSGSVEYVKCDGEGNVLRALEVIPAGLRQVAHVAVLDGDQRAVYEGDDERVIFLPGSVAPDELLIEYAKSLGEEDLGSLLGVAGTSVSRAVSHADGDEPHDWIHTFSKSLSIPFSEVFRRLAVAWAAGNAGMVQQFVRDAENFSSAA